MGAGVPAGFYNGVLRRSKTDVNLLVRWDGREIQELCQCKNTSAPRFGMTLSILTAKAAGLGVYRTTPPRYKA